MAPPAVSARLKYLYDSAHLLAKTAPGTSAYLMSRCNALMFEKELEQTDTHKRHICGACGNIMILGWTSTRRLEKVKSVEERGNGKSRITSSKDEMTKVVFYKCELCDRKTLFKFDTIRPRAAKTNISRSDPAALVSSSSLPRSPSQHHTPTKTPSSASANASSRRRAKVRKKGGLQALLAKSKEAGKEGSSSGFGLDLLDLMKKA